MADGAASIAMKICSRCRIEKPATVGFFYRCKGRRDGLHSACKPCIYRLLGRRRRPVKPVKRCSKCQEEKPATIEFFCLKQTGVAGLYSICKGCDALRAAQYRIENPPDYKSRLAYEYRWRASRPDRMRELYREQQKRRRKDGRYRASASMSCRIWKSLKGKGGLSWEKIVGYTRADLVTHLERQFNGQMSWSNFGTLWHMDHILPVSSFTFSGYEDPEFLACWALSNIRPLLKRDNLIKRDHRTHLI